MGCHPGLMSSNIVTFGRSRIRLPIFHHVQNTSRSFFIEFQCSVTEKHDTFAVRQEIYPNSHNLVNESNSLHIEPNKPIKIGPVVPEIVLTIEQIPFTAPIHSVLLWPTPLFQKKKVTSLLWRLIYQPIEVTLP